MKPKILLVDDRSENLLVLRKTLNFEGIEFLEATSGREALDLILRHDSIALALVDVQMPEMSGIELASLMRGSKRSHDIPIIFVTAHSVTEGIVFDGYESGAVDFIQKPFNAPVVRSKAKVFIELYHSKMALIEKCEQLDNMRLRAEKATAAKSQFVANISHDIRTPLSAVLGYVDLILNNESVTIEDCREYAKLIQRNGIFLTTLLDDVLSLSQIEAKRLKIVKSSCALRSILDFVRDNFVEMFISKGVDLHFEVGPHVPSMISTDQVRVQQVLNNLVSNSLKFTQSGSVVISLKQQEGQLAVEVRDTGKGIPAEFQERIFEAFESSHESVNRQGTGLGLRISKDLAQLLGGDLVLTESAEGKGSCFRLTFDHTPCSGNFHQPDRVKEKVNRPAEIQSAPVLRDMVILVVDDSSDNRTIFQFFLEHFGMKVHLANDGLDCLEKFADVQPDLVLLDLQMPVMDGYETARRLRADRYDGPIVALSAHAMEEVKHMCEAAGFTAHISKPVSMDTLRSSLIDILQRFYVAQRRQPGSEIHPS